MSDSISATRTRIDTSSITNLFGYNNRSELTSAAIFLRRGYGGQVGANEYGYVYDNIYVDLSGSLQGAGTIGGLVAACLNGTNVYYGFDGNGNVTDLTLADSTVVGHYEYDPYGNAIVKTGSLADANPYRFSTKYFDSETEQYYYGSRFLEPRLGRWLNRDPIGEAWTPNGARFPAQSFPSSLSSILDVFREELAAPYRFVQNSPHGRTDVLGLATTDTCGPCGLKSPWVGRRQKAAWKFEIDGCSVPAIAVPFASVKWDKDNPVGWCSFYAACALHDICWQTCNNETKDAKDKKACDEQFALTMKKSCDKCVKTKAYGSWLLWSPKMQLIDCYGSADIYAYFVGAAPKAQKTYESRQKQVCEPCCCPKSKWQEPPEVAPCYAPPGGKLIVAWWTLTAYKP